MADIPGLQGLIGVTGGRIAGDDHAACVVQAVIRPDVIGGLAGARFGGSGAGQDRIGDLERRCHSHDASVLSFWPSGGRFHIKSVSLLLLVADASADLRSEATAPRSAATSAITA